MWITDRKCTGVRWLFFPCCLFQWFCFFFSDTKRANNHIGPQFRFFFFVIYWLKPTLLAWLYWYRKVIKLKYRTNKQYHDKIRFIIKYLATIGSNKCRYFTYFVNALQHTISLSCRYTNRLAFFIFLNVHACMCYVCSPTAPAPHITLIHYKHYTVHTHTMHCLHISQS